LTLKEKYYIYIMRDAARAGVVNINKHKFNKGGEIMKQIILITILIVGLTAGYSLAQMGQDHMQGQGMMGQGYSSGERSGYPQGMGPGMMGYGGYGMMNPGMMGGHMGSMMGPGMMGGYGMNPCMMGGGMMGSHMGGYGIKNIWMIRQA
jgi:hypothetical protein